MRGELCDEQGSSAWVGAHDNLSWFYALRVLV